MQMSTPPPTPSLRVLTDTVIAKLAIYNKEYDKYQACGGKCSPAGVSQAYDDLNSALLDLSRVVSSAMDGTGGGVGSTQDILSLYYQTILPLREKMDAQAAEIRKMRGEPATLEFNAPRTKLELEEQRYNAVVYMGTLVSVIAVALMFLFFRSLVKGD